MVRKHSKLLLLLTAGVLLILTGMALAVTMGAKKIDMITVWNSLFNYTDTLDMQLVRDVRLPRALCTLLAGGLLGITGAMMQGVTRNPISEPSLMGISQGSTLAIAILYAGSSGAGILGNMGAAFLGALFSGLLIILFTSLNASHMSMSKLLLAGTSMSIFFTSLASVIALLTNQSQMLAFWLSGGFSTANWNSALLLLATAMAGFPAAIFLAPKINIVSLGDDAAAGLGVNAKRIRLTVLLLIIPLCAATVAVGRNIGFIGLIIPHITSRCISRDYRKIIPGAFVLGAALLIFADIAAKMVNIPYETPIGIFTSLIGIPFFIFLVRKERG